MIEIKDCIAKVEGSPKLICIELTHLLVHLLQTFEKEYNLPQEEAVGIINECARIAYMDDTARADYLSKLMEKD